MKRKTLIRIILAFFLCTAIAGIGYFFYTPQAPIPPILSKIDSLCETRPEEAMRLLDSVAQEMEQAREENARAKYHLLTIKARDKALIPHTSDSLIKTITDYYDQHGSTYEKIEAYYYYGSVCRDLHDSPGAISNYTHALEIAEDAEGDVDTLFVTNVYAQMSDILSKQKNYRQASVYTQKEDSLLRLIGKSDVRSIMDVAIWLYHDKKRTEAFPYYEEAVRQMRNSHDFDNNMDLLAEIFSNYAQAGDLYHADIHYALFDSVVTPENRPRNYYTSKAYYYRCKNIPDSAIHYYEEVYKRDPELDTKCEAARKLLQLYHLTGNDRKALEYGLIQATLQDTVWENLRLQQTADAYNQYRYQRDKQAETEAYRKALETWHQGVTIASVSGLGLFAGIFFFMRHRKRNRKTIEKQEAELREKDQAIKKQDWKLKEKEIAIEEQGKKIELTDRTIDRQDKDLRRLDRIIESHEKTLKEKEKTIEKQKKELREKDENIRTKEELIRERNETITQNQSVIEQQNQQIREITEKNKCLTRLHAQEHFTVNVPKLRELFKQAANGTLKPREADWMKLQEYVDQEHPEAFTLIRKTLKHPDKKAIRLCNLFIIGFKPSEIERIIGTSHGTVYRRIREISHLFGKTAGTTGNTGEERPEE